MSPRVVVALALALALTAAVVDVPPAVVIANCPSISSSSIPSRGEGRKLKMVDEDANALSRGFLHEYFLADSPFPCRLTAFLQISKAAARSLLIIMLQL